MSPDALLYVMSAAVVVSALALILQAVLMLALYRSTKALGEKVSQIAEHTESFVESAQRSLEQSRKQITEVATKAGDVLGLAHKQLVRIDDVLGEATARGENRDDAIGPSSFRWPHAMAVFGDVFWVADGGNHRVLGWRLPLDADRPADLVLGQPDFVTARELPHVPQGPARLRFPYAVAASGDQLIVADTANNRILAWTGPPAPASASGAAEVLGQNSFDSGGENRWTAVAADTLCWPYGLSTTGTLLAVADSGNNRVAIWERGTS